MAVSEQLQLTNKSVLSISKQPCSSLNT